MPLDLMHFGKAKTWQPMRGCGSKAPMRELFKKWLQMRGRHKLPKLYICTQDI